MSWTRRAAIIILMASLGTMLFQSCFSADIALCPDGTRCPDGSACSEGVGQYVCVLQGGCGDGETNSGEVCDDGNVLNGDGCSADCQTVETCGNGVIDRDNGEVCDDGNTMSGDQCSADCRSDERCGNGIKDVGEVCDSEENCAVDCLRYITCGNSYLDPGEVCDDGDTIDGDGCSANCLSNENVRQWICR